MRSAPNSPRTLQQRVTEVQRRLRFNRYLRALSVALLVAAFATLFTFVADKLFHLGLERFLPSALAANGAAAAYVAVPLCYAALALLASFLVWGRLRVTERESALRIDSVCDLRERVSSAEELQSGGAGAARTHTAMEALVVEDAARAASGVIPREVAPIALPRFARLVLFPALAALLVALFMKPMDISGRMLRAQVSAKEKQEVDRIAKEIRKQADAIANDMPLTKIEVPQQLVKELQELADELERDRLPRPAGAMKLAELADSIKDVTRDADRDRSQLDALRRLRHDKTGEDTSDENMAGVAKALEDGDLDEAAKALNSLKDKLADAMKKGLGDKESAEFKKQLEDLAKRLANKDPELAEQLAEAAKGLDSRDREALEKALENAGKNLSDMNDRMEAVDHLQKFESDISELAADLLESNTCGECGKDWKDHTGKESCASGKGSQLAKAGKKGAKGGEKGAGEKGEGAGEKGEGENGEGAEGEGGEGDARDMPGDLASELEAGRAELSSLEAASRQKRAPPSTLETPENGQQGPGQPGEGTGTGERPESGPSGSFVDTQIQAETMNRGTIIARKLKFGLPDDPGESSVPYSTTSAALMGEDEEALEGEGVPRERMEHVKAYLDLIKGMTPERRSDGGK